MTNLKYVAIVWGLLEILLFAGQIFGWSSLAYVFKYEGYFEDLCDDVAMNRESLVDVVSLSTMSPSYFVSPPSALSTRTVAVTSALSPPSSANSSLHSIKSRSRNAIQNSSDDLSYTTGYKRSVKSCAAVEEKFNLIYTLAVVFAGVTVFFTGFLMDRLGTRLCRCIGIVFYLTAVLLVAFSTKGTAIILIPAMMLLACGAYFFLLTNLQLGNLIPKKKSTLISLYCGAFDSSAFTMVLVKLAYDAGIPVKASFLFITCLFTTVIVSTFWFMPRLHIPFPLPEGFRLNFTCSVTSPPALDAVETDSTKKKMNESDETAGDDAQSFKAIAASKLFLFDVLWLTCQRFQSWSFIGRLNPMLNRLANNDKAVVSSYLSVYAGMQFLGIFLAPLSGRLMDRRSQRDAPPHIQKIERLEVCTASFVIDTTLGLLLAIVISIPVLQLQYFAFLLHVVHRALLYGPNSAFIAQVYGTQHFGKLFGLAMSSSAAFSLLQYPLFVLVHGPLGGDPFLFNMVVLALMLVSFVHPIYIWHRCRADRRAFQAEVTTTEPLRRTLDKL